MKYLILIITLFCLNTRVFSQDSIKIRTEIDTFSTPQYQSDYDAFFLKQQPMKMMFKLITSNAFIRDYGFEKQDFSFIPEFRLAKGISLNIGISYQSYYFKKEETERYNHSNSFAQVYLEPRFYFNKKQEIAQKLSADNLIGAYAGIRTGVLFSSDIKQTYFGEAVLGLQQLFFTKNNNDFFKNVVDLNCGLGVAKAAEKWQPSFHLQALFGGLFENYAHTDKSTRPLLCNVFQCFVEEKQLFKIDLMNLISIVNSNNLNIGLDVNYEQKISNSAFSINTGLNGVLYNFQINSINNKHLKGFTFKGYLEPRWYFNLKEEIANGTSANNLSGQYFALQLGYQNTKKNNFENTALKSVDAADYFYSYLIWGQQQRILKHFFLEGKGGFGAKSKQISDTPLFKNSYFGLLIELKLGLAF